MLSSRGRVRSSSARTDRTRARVRRICAIHVRPATGTPPRPTVNSDPHRARSGHSRMLESEHGRGRLQPRPGTGPIWPTAFNDGFRSGPTTSQVTDEDESPRPSGESGDQESSRGGCGLPTDRGRPTSPRGSGAREYGRRTCRKSGTSYPTPNNRWIMTPSRRHKSYVRRRRRIWATASMGLERARGARWIVGVRVPPHRVGDALVGGGQGPRCVRRRGGLGVVVRSLRRTKGPESTFPRGHVERFHDDGHRARRTRGSVAQSAWRTRGIGGLLAHLLVAAGRVRHFSIDPIVSLWDVAALIPR